MRRQHGRSTVCRIAVAMGVGAVTVAVSVAPASAQTVSEQSHVGLSGHAPTINTWNQWRPGGGIAGQGPGEGWADTFGQIITIPSDTPRLARFEFFMHQFSASGQLVMRGEVYAWDGLRATGTALWESAPRTVAIVAADRWKGVRFSVHELALTPGAQYVLFTSIAKDYEQCTLGYSVSWAAVSGKHYRGGKFVSQDNDGDESQWTTQAWQAGDRRWTRRSRRGLTKAAY